MRTTEAARVEVVELDARLAEFPLIEKSNYFESFEVGQTFVHHWGRTLTQVDNVLYNSLTLNYNPTLINAEFARSVGYGENPLNPYLVFLTVLGLSVEDTSEKDGGMFLSVKYVHFIETVYAGDTLTAASEVIAVRSSKSRPSNGIVTWRTTGTDQQGRVVLVFERTNLVARRGASS